jgi:hypothetical protein
LWRASEWRRRTGRCGGRVAWREFERGRAKDRGGGEAGEFVALERAEVAQLGLWPLVGHHQLHDVEGAELCLEERGVELRGESGVGRWRVSVREREGRAWM